MKKKTAGGMIRPLLLLIFSVGILIGTYKSVHIINMNRAARETYKELSAGAAHTAGTDTRKENTEENKQPDMPDAGSENSKKRQKSMDFEELQKDYPEISAWLCAAEIGIDYPVMQTIDNEYYLSHLPDGSLNKNGALFIDCNNKSGFCDANTVIYGHNMSNGTMFHSLNGYEKQDFYDKCPTMMLYTPEGDYRIELLCGTIEDGDYSFVKFNFANADEFNKYADGLKARSTFRSEVEVQPGDRLVSLCTCNYSGLRNGRYMLIGRMVELYEE